MHRIPLSKTGLHPIRLQSAQILLAQILSLSYEDQLIVSRVVSGLLNASTGDGVVAEKKIDAQTLCSALIILFIRARFAHL